MASSTEPTRITDEVRCSYQHDVMTRLRCSRCGKPICPRCGVRTPVGLRCPECAGVRGLPTYRTDGGNLLKAAAAGLGVAAAVGVLWGYFPAWQFYLSLLIGFGVAEAMAGPAKAKRGRDLQVVGIAAVLIGVGIGRTIVTNRLHLTWADVSAYSPYVKNVVYLRPIPDLLFVGLAALIVWYRFR
ncbi:MAG: B-box zinc finger protein [Thermomicrobiales bacterium]